MTSIYPLSILRSKGYFMFLIITHASLDIIFFILKSKVIFFFLFNK